MLLYGTYTTVIHATFMVLIQYYYFIVIVQQNVGLMEYGTEVHWWPYRQRIERGRYVSYILAY